MSLYTAIVIVLKFVLMLSSIAFSLGGLILGCCVIGTVVQYCGVHKRKWLSVPIGIILIFIYMVLFTWTMGGLMMILEWAKV